MRGVLVDFSAKSINQYYNLDPVPSKPFDRLHAQPDYSQVIRVLTNGHGQWKLNSEGHVVHFQAKHLAYIPKVWNHYNTSRLILTKNVCEVIAKCALLNYAILQDIPFDVGQVVEDAILHNRDANMNLGHPFLIYGLCKQFGVPLEDNEVWIHPIKAILSSAISWVYLDPKRCMTRAMNPRMRMSFESIRIDLATRSTPRVTLDRPPPIHHYHRHPPIHPPQPSQEEDPTSPSTILEDPVLDLTARFEAY